MKNILRALRQSFETLFRLRMLLLVIGPPLLVVLGLAMLFALYWTAWTAGLAGLFSQLWGYEAVVAATGLVSLAWWMAVIFLILAFLPVAFVVSILVVSIFVMPVVLKWVGDEDFKQLEKRRGGSVLGSIWNTLWASAVFILLFVVTLPLWLVPGFQILVPLCLAAWLNKRVFLYDVLQDYASKEERKLIEEQESLGLYGLGVIMGLLSYIPLVFLLVPVLSALSYTYYGLHALNSQRQGSSGN